MAGRTACSHGRIGMAQPPAGSFRVAALTPTAPSRRLEGSAEGKGAQPYEGDSAARETASLCAPYEEVKPSNHN